MFGRLKNSPYLCTRNSEMVPVVQLVRASDCGSECRGFESHRAPNQVKSEIPSKQRDFRFFSLRKTRSNLLV